MSLEQIDTDGTNDSPRHDEDEHRLDTIIANLNSRITAFEQKLQSAIHTENQFNGNIQTLLDSLDAFLARHVEKDRHLTQLIEEDTQRSKEAKEEYDALASRFDDNLRKDNLARTRDWLRTISIYVGIVLSVVFMAPLHALWWLLSRSLTRMGLLKSSEEPIIYANARRRARHVPQKPNASVRSQVDKRHRGIASSKTVPVSTESMLQQSASVLKRSEDLKEYLKDDDSLDPKAAKSEAPLPDTNTPSANGSSSSGQSDASYNHMDDGEVTDLNREKLYHRAMDSESEDEFFDARNGAEEHSEYSGKATVEQTEEPSPEEDENNARGDDSPQRPGWAVPAGSDETLPDLSSFPSSDFWEISDEDIRLEIQRSDRHSS